MPRKRNDLWLSLPLQVGSYKIENTKKEEAEIDIFNVY